MAMPRPKRGMPPGDDYDTLPPNKKHLAAWKPAPQREYTPVSIAQITHGKTHTKKTPQARTLKKFLGPI